MQSIIIRINTNSRQPIVAFFPKSNMEMRFASSADAREYIAACVNAGHTITPAELNKLS